MSENAVIVPVPADLGPAMNALNDRQRAFVVALYASGTRNPVVAARMAGYEDNGSGAIRNQAHRLIHRDDIQAAILEEGKRRMRGLIPFAMKQLEEIAENPQHKQQAAAVMAILNRGGIHEVTERNVNVNVKLSREEEDAKIRELAAKLGLDADKLLGSCVDAEFEEVKPPEEDW